MQQEMVSAGVDANLALGKRGQLDQQLRRMSLAGLCPGCILFRAPGSYMPVVKFHRAPNGTNTGDATFHLGSCLP